MAESTFLSVKKEVYNKLLTNALWYDYLASIAKYFFLKRDWNFYNIKEESLIKKDNLMEIRGKKRWKENTK